MRHCFILSDLHLCEAVPEQGLWLKYRQKCHFPDEEFAQLVQEILHQNPQDEKEIVLNGDVFDFDAPVVMRGHVLFDDQPRDEATAITRLGQILDDHTVFLRAVGQALAGGCRVVFIAGNHDAQLVFPGVQAYLTARVRKEVLAHGVETEDRCLRQLLFRAWFYNTRDDVHVEHGHQYDWLCSFRVPTEPFTEEGTSIQPNMGSLTFRHLVTRMGYFNPYVDHSFLLSLPSYANHWARYYLFSRHSLVYAWVRGALMTFYTTIRTKSNAYADRIDRMIAQSTAEYQASAERMRAHIQLFATPSDEHVFRVVRELRLDRLLMILVGCTAGIAGWLMYGWRASVVACAVLGMSVLLYEWLAPKPSLEEICTLLDKRLRDVADIHRRKAVVFGHTHLPQEMWERGVFYGNSGTWSASFQDVECRKPVWDGRPLIWLRSVTGEVVRGGLYYWRHRALVKAK
ncbi:MAG: metallophosphoesterase [Patescibacteria group bacterium]